MKRKFVCGMFALCLAISMAGCGKSSEEQQAANYYQNDTVPDKEDSEESVPKLSEESEEEPNVTVEGHKEAVVEPLPELVNSEWYECKVQIYDMVFNNDRYMTEEDIRKIVEGSAYDVELTEGFDNNGDACLDLKVDGIETVRFEKVNWRDGLIECGLVTDGDYYYIEDYSEIGGILHSSMWYDKAHIEFEDLETKDNVLAYLAENGFVEVESSQRSYVSELDMNVYPDKTPVEFADIPHYYIYGEYITFYRIHKVSETDQEVERRDTFPWILYSGTHLNLVNCVTFDFNPNGFIMNRPHYYELYSYTIMGELIGEKWDNYPQ